MSINYRANSTGIPDTNEERSRSDFYLENQILGSLNAAIQITGDACATVFVDLRGTFVGTFNVEGSVDGINYFTIPVFVPTTQAKLVNITTAGMYFGDCAAFKYVRLRCSAYTSGSATCCLRASKADSAILAEPIPSNLIVTTTAAAGVIATLSLSAPGVGLFHYITHLRIQRHTSALLVAGSAPIVVTSTNLPGSFACSFPADAATQGSQSEQVFEPVTPLKSSGANTATTIVMPATTGVIWRATAFYYAGA